MASSFDIIIIGSGAGGGTVARELASTGARILLVERGDFIPQEDQNWDAAAVWKDLRYRTTETWLDERGNSFRPYTHYCVGGNTKFWGTVMYRLRPEDFKALRHADGVSPAWPIDYDTLAPYYDRAEAMYSVHGEAGVDPTEGPRQPYPYPPVAHSLSSSAVIRFRSPSISRSRCVKTASTATRAIRSRARSTRKAMRTSAPSGRRSPTPTSRCG